jgi:hypothetical protein
MEPSPAQWWEKKTNSTVIWLFNKDNNLGVCGNLKVSLTNRGENALRGVLE